MEPQTYERASEITGPIDMESGEFSGTLFSNSACSDPHILDVAGIEMPERMLLCVSHSADPGSRLGSITSHEKRMPAGGSVELGDSSVQVSCRIDMGGDSAASDVRRDIARGISLGDLSALSGRWVGTEQIERSALSRSHAAHGRSGLYFSSSVAIEGSVVGIGADKSALIGRSQDLALPDHVRTFWRSMVAGEEETGSAVDIAGVLAALAAQSRSVDGLVEIETSLGGFYVPACVAIELEIAREQAEDFTEATGTAAEVVEQNPEPVMPPAITAAEVSNALRRAQQQSNQELKSGLAELLAKALGKV